MSALKDNKKEIDKLTEQLKAITQTNGKKNGITTHLLNKIETISTKLGKKEVDVEKKRIALDTARQQLKDLQKEKKSLEKELAGMEKNMVKIAARLNNKK